MCAPYAGITRVRFDGYDLRLDRADRTTPERRFDDSAASSDCKVPRSGKWAPVGREIQLGPGTDPVNPRASNVFGHIVRWQEDGADAGATRFAWDVFVLCGDPASPEEAKRGNIKGDVFGSPDGLWFDARGVLWIQTDVSTSVLHKGDYATIGNNQMLAADPETREVRRFLTGPSGCEVTGVVTTPDGRTMFVNIQHPGETPSERSDPKNPAAISAWPDGSGRPRSATVVIQRRDGGIIGT
jgi:uncharacterized protein